MRECFELADTGTEFVISRHRPANPIDKSGNWESANFRKGLISMIEKAGLEVWPNLWKNLRASRATELRQTTQNHVVNAFLGHSEKVANEHYVTITDDDFDRHTRNRSTNRSTGSTPTAPKTPHGAASESEEEVDSPGKTTKKAYQTKKSERPRLDDTGLEPATSTMSKRTSQQRNQIAFSLTTNKQGS